MGNKGRMGVQGRRERRLYDGEPLSITELLQKPGVTEYLERGGPLTDGERRNKLRRELKVRKFTKEAVDQFLSHRQRGTPRKEPTFGFEGGRRTLTEILDRNPDIRRAYEKSGVRTSHGQRHKLREDLLKGRGPRHQRQDSRKPKGGNRKKKKSKRPKDVRDEESQPPPEVVPRGGTRLLGNRVVNHYEVLAHGNASPMDFLSHIRSTVITFLDENRQNKVQLALVCTMVKLNTITGEVTAEEQAVFLSRQESLFGATDLDPLYDTMTAKILEAFATYQQNGSGWMLKEVLRADITLSRLRPLRDSSHTELPKTLAKRKALINMANDDEECFKQGVTRALNPVDKNLQHVTKLLRKWAKELCWDRVKFPTPCLERVFRKFEENNGILLRVFGHQPNNNGGVTIILLYAPRERREKVVRLFFLDGDDGTASHYCIVKNMLRWLAVMLARRQKSTSVTFISRRGY